MRISAYSLLLVVLIAGPALRSVQAEDSGKPMYAAIATDKFANAPGLPTCATSVV